MAEKGERPSLENLFSNLKQSLESLNRLVQEHCNADPEFVITDYESKSLTFQRNVFAYIEGLNDLLIYVLKNVAFKDEVNTVKQQTQTHDRELGDLRRTANTNFRSIEKDLETDLISIGNLRHSLATLTHNRTGDGTLNHDRNNHNNFKPKPPNFNNEITESPINFLNNMENYLRVVDLDQDELIYTIKTCLGKNCKAWFNVIKDKIVEWESFVEEFHNMYWNDSTLR